MKINLSGMKRQLEILEKAVRELGISEKSYNPGACFDCFIKEHENDEFEYNERGDRIVEDRGCRGCKLYEKLYVAAFRADINVLKNEVYR